jgi:hypothetical protein
MIEASSGAYHGDGSGLKGADCWVRNWKVRNRKNESIEEKQLQSKQHLVKSEPVAGQIHKVWALGQTPMKPELALSASSPHHC